jgi:hypothetical protein
LLTSILRIKIFLSFAIQSIWKHKTHFFDMSNQEHLQTLTEIRNLMEKSSRFISLSGLSGISAGIVACIGLLAVKFYWNIPLTTHDNLPFNELTYAPFVRFLLIDACLVLLSALFLAIYFTRRKARRKGLPYWDKTSYRLVINLLIPLVTGFVFCLAVFYHNLGGLIPAVTLVFYGLALINASKYTLHDIRILGMAEIILGCASAFWVGYGLLFWLIGFGVLHIIYGSIMYFKYEE